MEAGTHIERRVERVRFETDRHVVIGDVTLPPEGYQSRFSDSLNRPDIDFVPVVNVEITPLDGGARSTARRSSSSTRTRPDRLPDQEVCDRQRRPAAARGAQARRAAAALGVGAEVEEEGEDDDEPLEAVDAVGAALHITA